LDASSRGERGGCISWATFKEEADVVERGVVGEMDLLPDLAESAVE
jgi:hypothetical protein